MSNPANSRTDKFLWSVRIYKTRSQAADACKNGRVLVNSATIKPSHPISPEDIITVRKMPVLYTYRCKGIPSSRLGAKLVPEYLEDLTPDEELQKLKLKAAFNTGHRTRGTGRPTKRERRDLDRFRSES